MQTTQTIFFTFTLLFLSTNLTVATTKTSGYRPITNLEDPHVKQIANFAISNQNKKQNTNLQLVKIINAQKQIVQGTNYKLIITAKVKDGGLIFNYETVIFEGLTIKGNPIRLKLVSFKRVHNKINNDEIKKLLGGYQAIKDFNDSNVRFIGEFAVYEYNKLAKNKVEFVDIVKGEYQVVTGTNYRLVISAKIKKDKYTKNYGIVVFEGLPTTNPMLKLVSFKELLKTNK